MPTENPLPLSGVKVVDFSELLPGPFFTQNLLELGAVITKVERPPNGDSARQLYPGVFDAVNRGKNSVMLDLKQPSGLDAARKLIADADVLVEGFRPGVMQRLGLDYAEVAKLNPRVVYVALSGYGQTGPYRHRPGHDINYLASAGALALAGSDLDQPAAGAGIPVADLCGAMYALSSTLAALMQRQLTGKGQFLDISLTDCVAHWMNPRLGQFMSAKQVSLDVQRHEVLCKPAYGVFTTSDAAYVAIAALEDHFWSRLNQALSLAFDPAECGSYSQRAVMASTINDAVSEKIKGMTAQAAIALLDAADVPVSRVDLPLDLHGTEHAVARGLFGHGQQFVRYPVRLSNMDES